METNIVPTKFIDMVSNAFNTLLVGLGTVTFIWIVALVIVFMIEK